MRFESYRMRYVAVLLLLLVAAVPIIACRQAPADPSKPEGVVRLYLEALKASDVSAAYAYLAPELQEKCKESTLFDRKPEFRQQLDRSSVIVRRVEVQDKQATVETTINTGGGEVGILGPRTVNGWDSTYQLRSIDGDWRLSSFAWPVHWCEEPRPLDAVVPVKP